MCIGGARKCTNYDVVISHLQQLGWTPSPTIVINVSICGAIHQPFIGHLFGLEFA